MAKLNNTTIDKIIRLYFDEKLSIKVLSTRFGVSVPTISNYIRRYTAGNKKPENKKEVKELNE